MRPVPALAEVKLIAELPVALIVAPAPKLTSGVLTVSGAPEPMVTVRPPSIWTEPPALLELKVTLPEEPALNVWLEANSSMLAAPLLAVTVIGPLPVTEKEPLPLPASVSPALLVTFNWPVAATEPLLNR